MKSEEEIYLFDQSFDIASKKEPSAALTVIYFAN